ncbi:MAG: glucose-6-phosphate isomerase [Planctomycetes bacterium]|nr:glucose-6-phosphate isomerase [Planctomycetota bacterium]
MTSLFSLRTAGASADLVGREHGLSATDLEDAAPLAERAGRALVEAREAGKAGFLDLPLRPAVLDECLAAAEDLRGRCETLVVVGMGGSALGARTLLSALGSPLPPGLPGAARNGRPRVLVVDDPDPASFLPLLDALPPASTCWNFVSKSGKTLEPLALYSLLRSRLEAALGPAWRERVILTTDPAGGPLREEASRERLRSLVVPPEAGGRFSVLCAVGLLPAAAAGIDVRGLMRGAAEAAALFQSADPARNDALRLALWLSLLGTKRGKRHHVMVPYAAALAPFAGWWQQLWAESLGKNGTGFDATPAPGPGCQHSLLQLWMEGPRDKAFLFLDVEDPGVDRVIDPPGPPGAPFLSRRTLGDAHRALADGTAAALVRAGRPVIRISLPALRPDVLGAQLQLWMTATALAGPLVGVDPFGQPGVEEGKRNAASLLGREEDAARREGVRDLLDRLRSRR